MQAMNKPMVSLCRLRRPAAMTESDDGSPENRSPA